MTENINYNGFPIKSRIMKDVFQQVADYARQGYPVALFGPSGSGKEYLARYYFEIFKTNFAEECRFETINCAHLSDNLAVGELFGYTKGIFTGAIHEKEGLLENLKRGVLFLDEVGDLDEKVQAMLMRALHTNHTKREGRRLGANKSYRLSSDLSIICATEKPLNSIRESLLYRMGAIIHVPGLNNRPEDLESALPWLFAKSVKSIRNNKMFLARLNDTSEVSDFDRWTVFSETVSTHLLPLVQSKEWKGNFRSLNSTINQAIIRSANTNSYNQLFDKTVKHFQAILPDHTRTIFGEYNLIQEARSDQQKILEEKSTVFSEVMRIFPKISRQEVKKIVEFLNEWPNQPFKRTDFELFVDLYQTTRTAQKRLRELIKNKLVEEEKKGIYRVAATLDASNTPNTLPGLRLAISKKIINIPSQVKDDILPLVQNSRGLFIKAIKKSQQEVLALAINKLLKPIGNVYYFSFEKQDIDAIPELFKSEIESLKLETEFEITWKKTKTFEIKTAFLSGYIEQLVANEKKTFFILSHTNFLVTKEQFSKLQTLLRFWPFFRFILIGDKMANELEEFTEYVAG